jgi:hypothetical protein
MIITLTNVSGHSINYPAVGEDGVALPGGNHPEEATHRVYPLPYPFSHVGTIVNGGTKVFGMHSRDWRYSRSQMQGLGVSEKWNQLVQAGMVTLGLGAQANKRDSEELFEHSV